MSGRPSHQACNALVLCTATAFGTALPQGSDGSNRTLLLRTPQLQMEVAACHTGWLHQHPPCCCPLSRCLRRMHRGSCCARPSGNRQAQAQRSRALNGRQRLPPAGRRAPPRLLLCCRLPRLLRLRLRCQSPRLPLAVRPHCCSEAVNLDEVLLGELVGHQEAAHILALVALQLDDLPQLRVLHHGAVAAELCAQEQ